MLNTTKKQKSKKIDKAIYECASIMILPTILHTASNILGGIVTVKMASILGEFTDAALNMNLTLGVESTVELLICIIGVVCVIPLFALFGDFIMLKKCLAHDNLIFERYLDKDPEKAMALDQGKLEYELEDAPNTLRIQWVLLWGKALAIPICLGYLLYCAFKISWILTILMLILASARILTPVLFKKKLAYYDRITKEYNAKRRAYEGDITLKPYIIKLWGLKQPIIDRINQLFINHYNQIESRYIKCQVVSEQTREVINNITQLLLFLCGAIMVAESYVTPGEFTSVLVYLTVAETFLNNIGDIVQDYPLFINAANRVNEFYKDKENTAGESIEYLEELKGNKLSFAFSNKEVFQDIDFSIISGDKVLISGENGSGKSTLGKIMCTLIKNYTGSMTINNIDIKKINIEELRKIITYIPQSPCLFSNTVRENITMGNSKVDNSKVDKLMSEFGIFHLAERFIDNDSELSGGEKQKISLIRGLLRKSQILIMDEPSNHLDQESIEVLKRYIVNTSKTVILISHDSSLQSIIPKTLKFIEEKAS